MSSTIRNKRAVIIFECHTDYLSVFPVYKDDSREFGDWVKKSISHAADYCVLRGISRPDIHIFPSLMTQKDYDTLEVEEFLIHASLHRKSGDS